MNKIEVGMWTRYKYENCIYIGKIKFISEVMGFDETLSFDIDNCMEEILKKDIIGEPSFNIIDLIEVGDYVNECLVLFAGATTWDNDNNVLDKQVHINHNGYNLWLREEYIKSIVTKEQFEQMKYEVE